MADNTGYGGGERMKPIRDHIKTVMPDVFAAYGMTGVATRLGRQYPEFLTALTEVLRQVEAERRAGASTEEADDGE